MSVKISPQISSLLEERRIPENAELIEICRKTQAARIAKEEAAHRQRETAAKVADLENKQTGLKNKLQARFNLD